jgi:dihydroorotase-like cyclic amidohydrolase
MIPPLRTEDDVEALWLALRSRIIDVISTDHAPHPDEEKRRGELDIWKAPSGIPGVETLLPLMLRAVREGRINWATLVRSACENPARIFGLYPRKGTLRLGADADLVQIDPTADWSLQSSDLLSKAKLSPFCGLKFKGRPIMTMLRGQIVYERGKIQAPPGTGKFIRPQL